MRLYVLGPPRLEQEGRIVALPLRRALALLVYLACTGRPHSRDSLASLLWPDGCDSRARLRRTLHYVVSTVGEDVLDARGDIVEVASSALWVDGVEFRRRVEVALDLCHSAPVEVRIDQLKLAVEAYVEDFLTGFSLLDSPSYDEWQYQERESLRWLFAEALEQLAEAYREVGDLSQAIATYRKLVAHDPLHEPAHRSLMRLYRDVGQQPFALRQYNQLVRILDRELQVPPDAETLTLHDSIRSERAAGRGGRSRVTSLGIRRMVRAQKDAA